MPWLKLLHISAVIIWCGTLLYLPSMIKSAATRSPHDAPPLSALLPRTVFIGVVTPAALLAIGSGTLIFVDVGLIAPWLMLKLAVVGLLVLGHGSCGLLVLRAERAEVRGMALFCAVLQVSLPLLLIAIAWLVLRKPA